MIAFTRCSITKTRYEVKEGRFSNSIVSNQPTISPPFSAKTSLVIKYRSSPALVPVNH
jgi:hypothetical protein